MATGRITQVGGSQEGKPRSHVYLGLLRPVCKRFNR